MGAATGALSVSVCETFMSTRGCLEHTFTFEHFCKELSRVELVILLLKLHHSRLQRRAIVHSSTHARETSRLLFVLFCIHRQMAQRCFTHCEQFMTAGELAWHWPLHHNFLRWRLCTKQPRVLNTTCIQHLRKQRRHRCRKMFAELHSCKEKIAEGGRARVAPAQ